MVVSPTIVADVVGRGIWSLLLLSLFPSCSLSLQLLTSLFFPSSDSHRKFPGTVIVRKRFPGVWVNACQFHVPLANVLEDAGFNTNLITREKDGENHSLQYPHTCIHVHSLNPYTF